MMAKQMQPYASAHTQRAVIVMIYIIGNMILKKTIYAYKESAK